MKLTQEQRGVLARSMLSKFTPDEQGMFFATCESSGLDPFARQISANGRWDAKAQREVLQITINIDGFRAIASSTGKYRGQLGPYWCGKDGVWKDVWLAETAPAAAKVEIIHADFDKPLVSVATWEQYVQKKRDGGVNQMWSKMGPMMLAKCAEALGLRRAFPENLSGLYTADEINERTDIEHEPESSGPPPATGAARAKEVLAKAGHPVKTAAEISDDPFGVDRADQMVAVLDENGITMDDIRGHIRESGLEPVESADKAPEHWPYVWASSLKKYVRDVQIAHAEAEAAPEE